MEDWGQRIGRPIRSQYLRPRFDLVVIFGNHVVAFPSRQQALAERMLGQWCLGRDIPIK